MSETVSEAEAKVVKAWHKANSDLSSNIEIAEIKSPAYNEFSRRYQYLICLPRKIRRAMQKKWKYSLATIALLLALGASPVMGASINVDEVSSGVGAVAVANDTICSLPEAIISANDNNANGNGCENGSGDDEIVLPANSIFSFDGLNPAPFRSDIESLGGGTAYGFNALPVVASNITITGNNSTLQRANAGDRFFRLIAVDRDADLTLNDTTITGGDTERLLDSEGQYITPYGGGIAVGLDGQLTINNSIVTGNTARVGGGIYANSGGFTMDEITDANIKIRNSVVSNNFGYLAGGGVNARATSMEISNSVISGNTITGNGSSRGGGIYTRASFLTITDSTISGNSAYEGGGINKNLLSSSFSTTKIIRSTISGNTANLGAAIYSVFFNNLDLINSTVSGNTGSLTIVRITPNSLSQFNIVNSTITGNTGLGFYNSTGSVNIANSIISGNAGGNCQSLSSTADDGNNLSDEGSCNFGAGDNNTAINLGPLVNNGGPTQTHALLAGSSAIDNGNDTVCSNMDEGSGAQPNFVVGGVDQRSFPRPSGNACDIGAFELPQDPFIKITKLTDPTVKGTDFPFTLDGSTVSTMFGLADGEIFSSLLNEGTFTLTESNPPDFIVKNVECTDDSIQPDISIDNSFDPSLMLDFTLLGTEKLECTVTNTNDFSNLNVVVNGSGSVTGTGIDCPAECSEPVPNGETVTLTAIPAGGSQFDGFSGTNCTGSSPLDILVSGDINCTAAFIDIDDCSPNPCQNGGTCSDTGANSFSCDCSGTDFEGVTCETDINECSDGTDNCDENATCTNIPGSFTCECNPGYEGDGTVCTDIDACVNNPCDVNATCTDLPPPANDNPAGRTCECNEGFEGNGENCTAIPTGDDDDDDNDDNNDSSGSDVEIIPGDNNNPVVSINFGPNLGGGGQILVDLPQDVIAEFATLSPNIGTCEIVNPSGTARVTEPDVICEINEFPDDLDLFLNLCRESNISGIGDAVVEVIANNAPNEEFEDIVELILNQIRLCSETGDDGSVDGTADSSDNGCSVASGTVDTKSSLSNLLVTLIPAMVGFVGMWYRRRKSHGS